MDKKMMMDAKIEFCRNDLISQLESLIKNCQYEVDRLKKYENYKPNSLGIIQSNRIDVLCSQLYALHEGKELIEED